MSELKVGDIVREKGITKEVAARGIVIDITITVEFPAGTVFYDPDELEKVEEGESEC